MFKKVRIFIVLVLLFSLTMGNTLQASASSDITPPTVNSISFDKAIVQPGEKVLIQVEAEDLESGIGESNSDRVVMLRKPGNVNLSEYIYLTYNTTTKKYEAMYTVPSDATNGTWSTYYINFKDKMGNMFYSYPNEGNYLYKTFIVINGNNDTTPPTVNSINFDKAIVQPGEKVLIEVEAEDLESGIGESNSDRVVMLRKPGSVNLSEYIYLTYNTTTKKYEAMYTVPSDATNGTWSTYYINIKDKMGNMFYSYPNEGNYLYKTFTVINGNNDTTPPTVNSINFDKAIVQPGEKVLIEVEAEDSESGIGESNSDRVVMLRKPGSVNLSEYIYLTYNTTTKKYEAMYTVPSDATNGTWSTYYINFKDKMGNMFYSYPKEGNYLYKTFRVSDDIIPPEAPTFNKVTDKATSVTGAAEAGSTITVKAGTSILGTAMAKDDGTFSVPIDLQKAGTKLTVTATDDAGNVSEAKEVTVNDATAPTIPVVNEVSADKSTSVTGTAEAGSTITVKAGTTLVGTAVTNNNGTFSVPIDLQKAGTKLTITATDEAGNESEATEITVKDVTPPSVPSVNEITDKSTSVTGTAEAGSTITIKEGISLVGTAVTKDDGTFSITIYLQKAGTKLTVTATDDAGNESEGNEVTVEDVIPPSVPSVNDVTDKSTSVTGTAEAGSTITVKAGTNELTAVAKDEGIFTVPIDLQKAGTKLTITATDEAGNESEATEITVKDVTPPSVPSVNDVTDKSTSVTGTAEAGSTITVKAGTNEVGVTVVQNDGTFSVLIDLQKAGTKLTVTTTDYAGNVSEVKEVTVKDVTAPTIPVVNEVTDKDTSVTGQAEAVAKVEVKVNGSVIGSGTAEEDGQYKVTISAQKAGTELVIIATDKAGNVSETTTVVVRDVTAPEKPAVNEVTDKDTSVTGQAEAGSKVEVKINGSVIGTGNAGEDGQYKVTISAQKAGTELVITATDKAGNVSETTTVVVRDVTAPEKPAVNEVTDKDTSVTGQAEAGSKVEVKINGSVIGTGNAGEDGQYKVTISAQKAGTELVITATDKAGNVSEETAVVVKDATAPAKPVVSSVSDRDTTITGVADAGSNIEVKVNGSLIGTGTAGEDGKYKVTIRVQKAGTVLVITATDTAGNESEETSIKVIDKTAPSALTVNTVSDKTKEVTGKTEAGATVSIKIGTKNYAATADTNGNFKVIIPAQKAGTKLMVTAKDTAGNVSVAKSITVIDKTPPVAPTISIVSDLTKVVTGKAEAGAIVTVTIGTKKYIAKVDTKGNYKVTIPVQKAGTKIIVTAKDAAGNVSVAKSVIVIDKTAPTAPRIKTAVKSTTKEVIGIAEAYSTITIKVGSKFIGTAKADSKGNFKVKIKAQKKNTVLSVTATDKARNVSKATTVKVK